MLMPVNPRTTKLFTVSNKLTQEGGGGGPSSRPVVLQKRYDFDVWK